MDKVGQHRVFIRIAARALDFLTKLFALVAIVLLLCSFHAAAVVCFTLTGVFLTLALVFDRLHRASE